MKDFKKYFLLPATPDEVYAALTNPISLEIWTGESAEMQAVAGTEFSLWEGSITGKNIAFEDGKKLVQQWYFGDQEEHSIVTIKLHPDKNGTSVELRHTNIPDNDYVDITDGWLNTYFAALDEFFSGI